MGEFDLIAKHLAPLAGEGAFGLRDDAAEAFGQILTKDVLVEDVHFLADDPLELVARKALRVNMSDLISKGAKPTHYLLGLSLPKARAGDLLPVIAAGLSAEQRAAGLALLGGDTTGGDRLVLSITMIGAPGPRGMIRRSGGAPGQHLFVTGVIGDGLLGLEAARRGDMDGARGYHLPDIPLWARELIADHAEASLDISDGLVADAGHLATESGVRIVIEADAVPLSDAGQSAKARGRITDLLTGGDDYQSLMLVGEERLEAFLAAAPKGRPLTRIGRSEAGSGVVVLDTDGSPLAFGKAGWDHLS